MKSERRDLGLWMVPLSIVIVVVVAVTLLVVLFRSFEHSYMREAQENLTYQAQFISRALTPDLQRNDIAAMAHTIEVFREKPFRITIIAKEGTVVADSDVDASKLENHFDRPEVREEVGSKHGIVRYSETMQRSLLYYSVRTADGWIIRVSMPMDVLGGAMRSMRWTAAMAIVLGALLTAAVAVYLFRRERDRERNAFDSLFNALREPLLLISYEGAVLSSNRAARKLLGEAMRTDAFRINQLPSPDLISYIQSSFVEEDLHSREIPFNDRGIQRFLLARAVRLVRNGETCLLLLLTDLTDLRRLEGFRSDFVANVSHEIKTPLTAIVSTVETLSEMALDEPARKKCYDILSRQARRLNALVMDILSLAAIERRQSARKRDFTTVRLDAVVRDTLQLCQDEVERAGMVLKTPKTPFPELHLRGDAQLLEQALINLITNAVRYSGASTIEVSLTSQAGFAEIAVTDHGCGIAAEHLPRLFERFYRVQKDRSRECGGTGLGLAIVKHIVLLHRGHVMVKSTPGEGTTFTLQLPLNK